MKRYAHAIVTGGSSGIGLALVRQLLAEGSSVSVLALDDDDLARLAADLPPGARLHLSGTDVTDHEQVAAAVQGAEAEQGPPDLLVTCAGVVRPGYFTELAPAEFEREMHVNYLGTLWAIRAAAPSMVGRGEGTVMAISSFAGLLGVFGYSAYCPSKFAVRGLCETLRVELKPKGVHVGCVFPPDTDTPMLAVELTQKPPEAHASDMIPVMTPEAVAAAVLHGARRRAARVYPGRRSAVLARLVSALPGVTNAVTDRDVAKALQGRSTPAG